MMFDDEFWGVVLICFVFLFWVLRFFGWCKCEWCLGSVVGGVLELGLMMKKVWGLELDDWGLGERGILEGNGLMWFFLMYF